MFVVFAYAEWLLITPKDTIMPANVCSNVLFCMNDCTDCLTVDKLEWMRVYTKLVCTIKLVSMCCLSPHITNLTCRHKVQSFSNRSNMSVLLWKNCSYDNNYAVQTLLTSAMVRNTFKVFRDETENQHSGLRDLFTHHSVAAAPPHPVGSCPRWVMVLETDSCSGKRSKASGWGDAGWMELSIESQWVSIRKYGRSYRSAMACPSMDTCCLPPLQERLHVTAKAKMWTLCVCVNVHRCVLNFVFSV